MTTYTWPAAWKPAAFEMRVVPNVRAYGNPFAPSSTQVANLAGDYWTARVSLPPGISDTAGAAAEAFFDRLKGPTHKIALYNLKRPIPLGTLRDGATCPVVNGSLASVTVVNGSLAGVTVVSGTPVLGTAIPQFGTTGTIDTFVGRTLKAGDQIGLPNGQTVRQLVDTVANASGSMPIEFAPAARTAIPAHVSAIVWDRPTVNFRLRGDVPVVWVPGMFQPIDVDLIEAT